MRSNNLGGGVWSTARHALVFAFLLGALILSETGCGGVKVSDSDIEYLEVADAYEASRGESGMFGLGERKGIWIDPRVESTYAAEHIRGAVNIPLGSVREDDPRLDGFNVFIVYGGDFDDAIATAMTKRLMAMGYEEVRLLRGGLRAWKQAGNEVEGEEIDR